MASMCSLAAVTWRSLGAFLSWGVPFIYPSLMSFIICQFGAMPTLPVPPLALHNEQCKPQGKNAKRPAAASLQNALLRPSWQKVWAMAGECLKKPMKAMCPSKKDIPKRMMARRCKAFGNGLSSPHSPKERKINCRRREESEGMLRNKRLLDHEGRTTGVVSVEGCRTICRFGPRALTLEF